VDLDAWVDRTYVDNAVKSLKLETLWPDRSATGALQN
jgi:sulfonate transport system substrate-binding protein